MLCREIMKSSVQCLSMRDSVQVAAKTMRDANIGFLPICDEQKKVMGVVTDRDLTIRVMAEGKPHSVPAVDVMSREVVACRPEDDVRRAQELMSKHHKSRILCIDPQGKLAGVISLSDIAQQDGVNAVHVLREVSGRESRTRA